jgi:hypothetical protein
VRLLNVVLIFAMMLAGVFLSTNVQVFHPDRVALKD